MSNPKHLEAKLTEIRRYEVTGHVTELTRRVALRMHEIDITMAQLAERMGMTHKRVSTIARQRWMTQEVFDNLSRCLEMDDAAWHTPLRQPKGTEPGLLQKTAKDIARRAARMLHNR